MSCPTCDHAMSALGCTVSGMPLHHCSRCGTLKTCDGSVAVPALVKRCREFDDAMRRHDSAHPWVDAWHRLGIAETIYAPKPSAE